MDSMSWYNPLPGWIGWVATAIIVLVFAYLFYKQRKRKANDTRTHAWTPVDGFGTLWIPLDIPKKERLEIAGMLHMVQLTVWDLCDRAYPTDEHDEETYETRYYEGPEWYIDTIGLGHEHPSDAHQYVSWHPGAHKMELKVDDQMYYWFAREVHNIYRCFMYGRDHIYDTLNAADLERANGIQLKIVAGYYQEEWDNE